MKIKNYASFLILALTFTFFCYSVPDEQCFLKALEAGGPAWMDEQIESDLAPFKDGISKKLVDRVFNKLDIERSLLVRITKKGHVITCRGKKGYKEEHKQIYVSAMEYLDRVVGLPDFDLLLTLFDTCAFLVPRYGTLQKEECIVMGYGTYAPEDATRANKAILIPDFMALNGLERESYVVEIGVNMHPWESKIKLGFWRGAATGGYNTMLGKWYTEFEWGYHPHDWKTMPRSILALYSREHPDVVDAKFVSGYAYIYDTFVKEQVLGSYVHIPDQIQYSYLVDVDGYGMTVPRSYWILRSNSLLVKQKSDWVLWFSRGLVPYVNYVPFTTPDEDLEAVIEWARAHDDQAKEIAYEGRRFALEDLSIENTYVYLYKLLMAYSALQNK